MRTDRSQQHQRVTQSGDFERRLDAIWRIESPRLIGALMRVLRDLSAAEDVAQDAFVAAIDQWPAVGIPANPGAWLMTAAKRRAIDRFRRAAVLAEKTEQLERSQPRSASIEDEIEMLDQDVGDEMLRLMFIACHPVLSREARVALTLRLIGGLTTAEIARAFFVPEPTIAQRIVRAKRTLGAAGIPFELPAQHELRARLAAVLEVVYLIFNEGYSSTSGPDVVRPELCEDALRIAQALSHLRPDEGEVHGLLSLIHLQFSRSRARADASGAPVLLADQSRDRWDRMHIRRGLQALERAKALGELGPYALQAAIAACHARAARFEDTDWPQIAALYDALASVVPSPVVELNRAVAVGMAFGAEAGLAVADGLTTEPVLQEYHLLPAVRADMLERLCRFSEAAEAFERAAQLAQNERDRTLLHKRAAICRTR